MKTLDEIEAILDSPLQPYDVDWKPFDSKNQKWVRLAPYIDARAVRRLLDAAFTRWGWSADYKEVADGFTCTITASFKVFVEGIVGDDGNKPISLQEMVITKTDGANREKIEPVKSGISNALKRAAVGFGIGASLYDFPQVSVAMVDKNGDSVGSGEIWKITDWALPELDKLVAAYGGGWRPTTDRVYLSLNKPAPWSGHKAAKKVVERVTEPEDTARTKPAATAVLAPAPLDPPKPDARLSKKETAEWMGLYQDLEAKTQWAFTPEDFNLVYDKLKEATNFTQEQRKAFFLAHLRPRAEIWGLKYSRDLDGFYAYYPETDTELKGIVQEWWDAIDNLTTHEEAGKLYDDFKSDPVLRAHLHQPLISLVRAKGWGVSDNGKDLEFIAF